MTKSEPSDYNDVCAELDKLSSQMLDAMKEYLDCKVIIENYIKTGSLHLAKARYIMGNKSVSYLQLPTEDSCDIPARTRVSHVKQKSGSTESLIFEIDRLSLVEKQSNDNFNLKHRGNKTDAKETDNVQNGEQQSNDDDPNSKNRRPKKKPSEKQDKNDESTDDIKGSGKSPDSPTKGLSMSKDPLKWFGVLVPQNLKHAQTNFSTALDYVVQCVNIQIEMDSIRSKYVNLLKLKKDMTENKDPIK